MWPFLLDMTNEECTQSLRNLELEAYSQLVSALRAQGPLNAEKRKLLKDTGQVLSISQERHKAEVRRAINDEKLNTIAYHVTGHSETTEDWAQEGRRLMPLLPRTAPQTAYSALADEIAESASQYNKQLPTPTSTERKRHSVVPPNPIMVPETSKTVPFRIPDPPKAEESKKRKQPMGPESSSLAQHLLSPKLCRIQQLYRQRSKPKPKDIQKKIELEQVEMFQQHRMTQSLPSQPSACSSSQSPLVNQKVNVLQNISLHSIKEETSDCENEAGSNSTKIMEHIQNLPICSNENQAPRPKIVTNVKSNTSITIKSTSQFPGPSSDGQKIVKTNSLKKAITKTVNSGQKLIVVSNAQTIPSNSILQRTLQIPFAKNVSIKNFEKFKIVTNNLSPTTITVANVSTNSAVNPLKHKVVTVKTNSAAKKVIPLSQLQVLNSKGSIKVLPLGGKIVGKTIGTSASPLYIVNTTQQLTKSTPTSQVVTTSKIHSNEENIVLPVISDTSETAENFNRENGKSSVLTDILKASGVISDDVEDYDHKIEEFHIPQLKKEPETEIYQAKAEQFLERRDSRSKDSDIETCKMLPVALLPLGEGQLGKVKMEDHLDNLEVIKEVIEPEIMLTQVEIPEIKSEIEGQDKLEGLTQTATELSEK